MIFGEASISLGKGDNYTGPTAYCSIHPSPYVTLPRCHVATLPHCHVATLPHCQVMVRNIPKACSREAIVELLSPCGLANRRRDDMDGPMGDYSRGTG